MSAINPWKGSQALRRKAYCKVFMNGVNVTSKLDPHLLSVSVILRPSGSDMIKIELDDREGRLQLPPQYGDVEVHLGWESENLVRITRGMIQEYESSFDRHSGRTLSIVAPGSNFGGQGRSIVTRTWGTGAPPGLAHGMMISIEQVLKEAAEAAGYTMEVSPAFSKLKRDWWQQINESFHHFGMRMAQELGGVFKLDGNRATFSKPGEAVDGKELPTIQAKWGDNLLSWRIKPFVPRGTWSSITASFYDAMEGAWKSITSTGAFESAPFKLAESAYRVLNPQSSDILALQAIDGSRSQMEAGLGWIIINGEPLAVAGGKVLISGARDGVDKEYLIHEAEHSFSAQGFRTRLQLTSWIELKTAKWS